MISKEIVIRASGECKGCVLVLPGRGLTSGLMERFMHYVGLWKLHKVILEPDNLEWYPVPNGINDQEDAIAGLTPAKECLEKEIGRINKAWGFESKDIAIVGFSAGSVMALHLLAHSNKPYAGILSLAGAILEPEKLPKAKFNTPVLLQHNEDDMCFEWEERYLPMKKALTEKGYNLTVKEGCGSGHNLTGEEVDLSREFLIKIFNYSLD